MKTTIRKPHKYMLRLNYKNPYTDINNQPINDKNKLGYCHNNLHIGFINLKILKEHNCTKKNCPYFTKYTDHPYWKKKEWIKKVKKERKKSEET